jgi:cold-inducible RNA-binding protein
MSKRLFVGNLSFQTTEETLTAAFQESGTVVNATIITDRETQRPRGFGFVEMGSEEEAQAAMEAMDGVELDGRPIRVNEAEERRPRARRRRRRRRRWPWWLRRRRRRRRWPWRLRRRWRWRRWPWRSSRLVS